MALFSCCNCDTSAEKDTQLSIDQNSAEVLRVSENGTGESEGIIHMTPEDRHKEKERLHKLVKTFAKAAVAGAQCLFLDVTTGEKIPAKYIINKSMETFSVAFDDEIRLSFDMRSLQDIYSYEDIESSPCTKHLTEEKAIADLSASEKQRLAMLEYSDPPNTHLNRIFFIDREHETDRDRFVICMKILRLYCINCPPSAS